MITLRRIATGALTGLLCTSLMAAPQPVAAAEPGTPVQTIVDIPSHWGRSGLIQSEIYEVTVAAGLLRIVLSDLPEDGAVGVALESKETGEVMLQEQYRSGGSPLERYLPAGTYLLAIVPNKAGAITLHGMDLIVSPEMPGLRFPEMEPFETRNERFTLQPELLNAQATASLKLLLGEATLSENMLRADGTVAPATLDPANLEDGLYVLTGLAAAKASENLAITARTFLVDRVDSFGDVPATHWARRYIEIMRHIGILNGRGEGEFAPAQPVTRAEFAKMLALSLGLEVSDQKAAPFVDVPDDWSKPYIDALYEQGLIKGETVDGKSYYYPARTITRAEAATIVGRVLGMADASLDGKQAGFADFSNIPEWARPSVVVLAEMKWINGFPDGRYMPMQTLQRDQAARILANFIGVR